MIEPRKYPAIGQQYWKDVFFMHWKVGAEELQRYVPAPFKVDTFEGLAWITVVCFVAEASRPLFFPISLIPPSIQINVRTYVTCPHQSEPGVYFFNVYLNNHLAVLGARKSFNLPFYYAHTSLHKADEIFTYKSKEKNETKLQVSFQSSVEKVNNPLADFLTERYTIWVHRGKRIVKIPITHSTWQLHLAKATILEHNFHPIINKKEPNLIHFGRSKLAKLYPYETVAIHLS